jgi:predicted metal-dependent hydrolase
MANMRKHPAPPFEPTGVKIIPREIAPGFSEHTPRYWFDNHPFKTHYFNALSSTFPVGERFFIRSVRYYQEEISESALEEKVRNFIGQEGHHSIEHDAHIRILQDQGYIGIRRFEHIDKTVLDYLNRRFPRFALAATISLEHLTAILADELLRYPRRWLQPMHKDMQLLWRWHAVEETEHKAVAYDVYQQVCGSYGLRVMAMIIETLGLLTDVLARTAYFLWKDGLFWRPSIWAQGIVFVWGRHGALSSVTKAYLQFFRRDFHPWQNNNYHFVEQFQSEYPSDRK